MNSDEIELRALIDRWSKAVREENLPGILADHDPDLLMFDVPPPFSSRGLEAYRATWGLFFRDAVRPVAFDFTEVEISAGQEVAFATATGHCNYCTKDGTKTPLEFRLTMGFRKRAGRWQIAHEHHSVPAGE